MPAFTASGCCMVRLTSLSALPSGVGNSWFASVYDRSGRALFRLIYVLECGIAFASPANIGEFHGRQCASTIAPQSVSSAERYVMAWGNVCARQRQFEMPGCREHRSPAHRLFPECRRAQQTLTVRVEVAASEGRGRGERGSSSTLHGRHRKTECLWPSRYCDWAERRAAGAVGQAG